MFGSKIHKPQQANYIQPGPMSGGGGGGPLKQMAMMGMKSALSGSPMAPLAGVIGGLFNDGGKVSWWQKAKNTIWGTGPKKGSIADQINWGGKNKNVGGMVHGYNMGGPLSAHPNPYNYNEGGSVGETPIKKVMDEQKLEQQAMAFELEQKRKQEAHDQTMRIKEQQAKEAAKMKKASATTNKTATSPKGPLASKK